MATLVCDCQGNQAYHGSAVDHDPDTLVPPLVIILVASVLNEVSGCSAGPRPGASQGAKMF